MNPSNERIAMDEFDEPIGEEFDEGESESHKEQHSEDELVNINMNLFSDICTYWYIHLSVQILELSYCY